MSEPIVVSWSEIDTYRQCPFKHRLGYIERWQSDIESPALSRGTFWHKLLELRYQAQQLGPQHEAEAQLAIEGMLVNDDGSQTEEQELLEWMYNGYCDRWDEEDAEWQIQGVEFKGFASLDERFVLKVKIDLIASRRGRLWIWDHKSGKRLPNDKELDLDDQMGLYIWLLRQMGYPVAGAVYNAAKTYRTKDPQRPSDLFMRIPLRRNNHELDVIAQEALATCYKMWPVEPSDRPIERNTNSDTCRWRCNFTEACLADRKGGKLVDMLEAHGFAPSPFREVELEYRAAQLEKAGE